MCTIENPCVRCGHIERELDQLYDGVEPRHVRFVCEKLTAGASESVALRLLWQQYGSGLRC